VEIKAQKRQAACLARTARHTRQENNPNYDAKTTRKGTVWEMDGMGSIRQGSGTMRGEADGQ
jgi:hypothetical protein